MDNDAGGWLWFIIDVILFGAFAVALLYATMMWRARRRNPALERMSERATERLYERAAESERRENAEAGRRSAG
jgi:Flp pilus assembly protein TadB